MESIQESEQIEVNNIEELDQIQEPTKVDVQEPTKVDVQDPTKVDVQESTKVDVQEPTKVDVQEPTKINDQERVEDPNTITYEISLVDIILVVIFLCILFYIFRFICNNSNFIYNLISNVIMTILTYKIVSKFI